MTRTPNFVLIFIFRTEPKIEFLKGLVVRSVRDSYDGNSDF